MVQNYSHYEQVAYSAFPKRAVMVSVTLMQMRRREAGQGGGWGCGPEQLAATVPCALFTVDVSQWRGAQPLAVFCKYSRTHGSPGALYLNNIIYIDIYII